MRSYLVKGLLGTLGAIVLAYAIDSVVIRARLSMGGPARAYDSVTVLYAAGLKNSKLEIYSDAPGQETCARALFPQMGYLPCWYVRQHTMQVLD